MKRTLTLFSISWLLALSFFACSGQSQVQQIKAEDVIPQIEQEDWQFVDVRTPGEVERGYLKGTDHFFNYNSTDFEKKVENLDKSRPVLFICHSGVRSRRAAQLLVKKGFTDVYDLQGGLMRWQDPSYIVKE
jgi:rhodanese-related sulfurtransferase